MNRKIHIVCHDAPAPPDYGGVMDLYYKIVALSKAGVQIILHYFNYKNRNIGELANYCTEVYSYQRKMGFHGLQYSLPYIVSSRINTALIERLNKDNYPILLEYIHCTGIVPFLNKNRKIIIRLHNDEALYYQHLAASEKVWWKKQYYRWESKQLYTYQKQLSADLCYVSVSDKDARVFKEQYGLKQISFLPCFLPWQTIESKTGLGSYCLYHGNLTVPENEKAAIWLLKEVAPCLNCSLIIAGKGASTTLKQIVSTQKNSTLIDSPADQALKTLIQEAHVHILPSFNETGVKLKLLHALFQGRHCISNPKGIVGSGITQGVHIAHSTDQFISAIQSLIDIPFTEQDIVQRKEILALYNNSMNAGKLITWLNLHYP